MLSDAEIMKAVNPHPLTNIVIGSVPKHYRAIAQAQDKATKLEIAEWAELKAKDCEGLSYGVMAETYRSIAAELRKGKA